MTAPSGPDSPSAYESAFGHGLDPGAYLDDVHHSASRRLIATAVGIGSPPVLALADWLTANGKVLEAILTASLSDPDRLQAVRDTGLLDGGPHPAIDSIAQMTAETFGTPFAAVSLVLADRHILVGCSVEEAAYPRSGPLDESFSTYIVASGEPLIVNDATMHPLLARHPAVEAGVLCAFAGIPLADAHGHVVGAVAIWDSKPHYWTVGQIQLLIDLTDVAAASIYGESAFRPPVAPVPPVSRGPDNVKRFVVRNLGV